MARFSIDEGVSAPLRRVFLVRAISGMAAFSNANESDARIAIACLSSPPPNPALLNSFQSALAKLDSSLALRAVFTADFAHFDTSLLLRLARAINERKPALILCFDLDAALAVVATRTATAIPLVFRAHGDPKARGLIDSYARPGRNLTGITTYRCLDDKLVEIIRDAIPTAKRIGFVRDAADPESDCNARAREYALQRGISLLELCASSQSQLPALLRQFGETLPDALIVGATALTWSMRKQIITRIDELAIPTIYEGQVFVDDGGLMQFSALPEDAFDRMARAAAHILRHGGAGDFPVSQPVHFELVINMKARHAESYRLSPQILRRADRILE